MKRWLILALGAMLVIAGLLAVLQVTNIVPVLGRSGASGQPHVFVDSYGRCPGHLPDTWPPDVCHWYKHFNAEAGKFDPRSGPWGIAYSFNCGAVPAKFEAAVVFPDGDGVVGTGAVLLRARSGSGFSMEMAANNTNRPGVQIWDTIEGIGIQSTCAWHIRAIDGRAKQVRRFIPPVPPVYRMNFGRTVHLDSNSDE